MEGGHDGAETGNLYATVELCPSPRSAVEDPRARWSYNRVGIRLLQARRPKTDRTARRGYSRSYRFVTRVS